MTAGENFRLLLNKHYGNGGVLVRLAISIVKDSDEAQDVVQTALVKAYLSYNEDVRDFRAWLSTIVRRVAYTAYTQKMSRIRITKPLSENDDLSSSTRAPEPSQTHLSLIRRMLEIALTSKQISKKEYEVLRYDNDFKDRDDLAEFLHISRNYCDQLHFRGLKKFVRSIFTHSIKLLGGINYVNSLFVLALVDPPPEFTESEEDVFREQIIHENTDYVPENWEKTLLSACYKMLSIKQIENKFFSRD